MITIQDKVIREMVDVLQCLAKDYPKVRKEILKGLKLKEREFDEDVLELLNAFVAAGKELED